MAGKLDDKLSNVFIKQDTGLYTELFIIGELGLKDDEENIFHLVTLRKKGLS